jgi:hypothetical protein
VERYARAPRRSSEPTSRNASIGSLDFDADGDVDARDVAGARGRLKRTAP